MSHRTLMIFLAAPPYGGQDAETALRLAAAALDRGHAVQLFASANAVHLAQTGQRPSGLPDLPAMLAALLAQGLRLELCGSCLHIRGIGHDQLVSGATPSSLKGLFDAMTTSDAVLTLGA